MERAARHAPYGVLVLHGLTSGLGSVTPIAERLEARGLPCAVPWLRGHGTRAEDLRGVTWHDWYADAAGALDALRGRCATVAVVGLSMGGLLALHLALRRPSDLRAVVAVAPALRQAHPLAPLVPWVAPFWRTLDVPERGFRARHHLPVPGSYARLPTDAYLQLIDYARWLEPRLPGVHTPTLILHALHDRVIEPASAARIYMQLGASDKELRWYHQSGHEMLVDCEADAVLADIEAFVLRHAPAPFSHHGPHPPPL